MPLVGGVQPQLLHTVAVVVAGVALQVHGIADGDALEAPLVGLASFFDVGHQLVLLHVLIGFAVELEVGLELRVVVAQLALVHVAHHGPPLVFWEQALGRHVRVQSLQAVRGEFVAHSTLEKFQQRVTDARRQLSGGEDGQVLGH